MFVTTTLKVTTTELKPSERVRVTKNVPMSAIPGDIVIILPLMVTANVAAIESEIITTAPSGSVATGKVYVELNPALMLWETGAV